jgi:hypothetical protein
LRDVPRQIGGKITSCLVGEGRLRLEADGKPMDKVKAAAWEADLKGKQIRDC